MDKEAASMQQVIHSAKGPIQAKMILPGSKSITNRALLLAALAEGVSEISGIYLGSDTKTLLAALHQLGIVTQLDEKTRSCIIAGGGGKFPKKQGTLWCDQSTAITRFLMAVCSATPGVYYFDGSPSLRKKAITQLLNVLLRQGVQLIPNDVRKMPFTLIGVDTLEGGEVLLDDKSNTQLISALLMIAPYSRSPFTFTSLQLQNQPSIDMTCAMMAEFGVLVHRVHQGQFMVPVPQRYNARDYMIEPDFSIASYFFAAAAVTGGKITIQPTKRAQSKQPNVKFLSILEKMGCRILETHTGLTLESPPELHGIEVSMRKFSDTFLALAVIAPFAKSPTRISHIGHLSQKEQDRMLVMKSELIKMGINVEIGDNWIKIFPGIPEPGMVNSHQDYRIAMAFAVIGLKVPDIIIDNIDPILNIYPDFFTLWEKLAEHTNISA